MVRDQGGVTLSQRLDAMEAPDDRTIVLRLNKPFPHLRTLLSKLHHPRGDDARAPGADRSVQADPRGDRQRGPFLWLADEHMLGSHAAFAKFDRYVPRDEPASYTAGGHRVLVDRVEWKIDPRRPDRGQWTGDRRGGLGSKSSLPDLLSTLKKAAGVKVGVLDTFGQICFMRPNHIAAPTSNPGVRVVRCWPQSTSRR